MENEVFVSEMLLRRSRLASRICRLPVLLPLTVTATITRLASRLGGMGRLAKVNSGNLYASCAPLRQEVRPTVANAIRRPQTTCARKDWEKRLRFFNGKELQPECCDVFSGHCPLPSITKYSDDKGLKAIDLKLALKGLERVRTVA